ncbi:MAG: glycosyltransferase family 2 protein [Patescibacteria group bacterium]
MLSIIIPTLNEEEGIAKVICSIPKKIRKFSEVIVTDASSDMTPIIAENLGVKVLRLKKKGKGFQMKEAVKQSSGDILIFLDGDGTDPAEFIPALLKKLENSQLVLGCRSLTKFDNEEPEMRQFFQLYKAIASPVSSILGLKVSDPLAGFRAIRRKDWDALNLQSDDFDIETEMNIKAINKGFTIKEVLIPNLKRCGGAQNSKFIKNPKMWFKIFKMLLEYKIIKLQKHESL